MNKIFEFLSKFYWQLGIDLGSRNSRVIILGKGIVLNLPTAIARLKKKINGRIRYLVFGQKAYEIINRETPSIEVIRPIKRGVVADLQALEVLVSDYFLEFADKTDKYPKLFKPRIVLAVPSQVSEVQKRAYVSIFNQAGISNIDLVYSSVAGAYGSGFNVDSGGALMVVDVGFGKTEASLVSLAGVVVSRGIDVGGSDYDEALVNYLKMKYGILIGKSSAEKVKNENGGIIRGRNLELGLPKSIRITGDEIIESGSLLTNKIVRLVKNVLDEMPTEMSDEVLKHGILLIGGGAKFPNLARMIEEDSKINTILIDNPELAVVNGCSRLLENNKLLNLVKIF